MAKVKREKLSNKQSESGSTTFASRCIKEVGFISFGALSIFLLVALITYNNSDTGWSHANSASQSANAAGAVGAWMADCLLNFFGYIAYLFPVAVFLAGFLLLKTKSLPKHADLIWGFNVTGLVLALASGCALTDIALRSFTLTSLPGPSGGIIGSLLAELLVPKFSTAGSVLLFLAIFMIGITIGTGISWVRLMEMIGKATIKTILNYKSWLQKLGKREIAKEFFPAHEDKHIEPTLSAPIKRNRFLKSKLEIVSPEPVAKPIAKKVLSDRKPSSGTSKLPDLELLEPAPPSDPKKHYSMAVLENLSREVEEHLLDFGAEVKVVAVCPGPIITRFEMTLAPGLKVSKISGLAKDLARSLSVTSVRVVEVIPGKAVVGLEIPNKYREIVKLRDVLESPQYQEREGALNIALGKDISGEPVVVSLDRMPHLLVAGTTGSGKSVGVNVMLLSLLYKATPTDLRLILIDPKMLELSIYDGIGHLLTPVVTDMNDAANALRWCVAEMERRYQLMAAVGVRNLAGFNAKVTQAAANGKPLLDPLWDPNSGGVAPNLEKLPFIVVIIDEFADMMMVVGKKVEELIARIAQKARAAGIHLILATQRPSVDVITGLIKANVPTRIAFQVSSRIDSRTILDQQGAEQLLGHGDMLYLAPGTGIPTRVHGAFVSDEEVHAVVNALKQNSPPPEYIEEIANSVLPVAGIDAMSDLGEQDPLYDEAVAIVTETRKASISYLQRRLKIGYNRSARLIEAMETAGVVSEMLSNGVREVLAFDAPRK
ncbi:MAG TPA: DNA translocase FtsK 4TM domain-containing protein [Gammaproteobacteria bacterium]|nr:DNA translocase FtsK 4TM domain-containing protein [Gammaproteobacteria bacterium]